jgi:hypothetical protein
MILPLIAGAARLAAPLLGATARGAVAKSTNSILSSNLFQGAVDMATQSAVNYGADKLENRGKNG